MPKVMWRGRPKGRASICEFKINVVQRRSSRRLHENGRKFILLTPRGQKWCYVLGLVVGHDAARRRYYL